GARRMAETAALLADEVLPDRPMRQWVLSLPFALRFLLSTDSEALTLVLGIVYRAISGFILEKAGLTELQALVERIAERIGRALERRGLIERDCENAYLSLDPASDGPLDDLIVHSITYRIAV